VARHWTRSSRCSLIMCKTVVVCERLLQILDTVAFDESSDTN
jgi:hypothetical protein